jgi:hypothetical protein
MGSGYDQELGALRKKLANARIELERENHEIRAGVRSWLGPKPKAEAFQCALEDYYDFLAQGRGGPWGASVEPEPAGPSKEVIAVKPRTRGANS